MITHSAIGIQQYSAPQARRIASSHFTDVMTDSAVEDETTQYTFVEIEFMEVSPTVRALTNSEDISTVVPDSVEFEWLVVQWRQERGATSSITKMATCPSYQRIIAMGDKAIPLILRALEREGDEPDMWFWALQVLANANPVEADAQGDIVAMAKAWLAWGRKRYAW